MRNLADSHLTYIGARAPNGVRSAVCYDVYPREGGLQLGWVYRTYAIWTAMSDDPTVDDAQATTRWEAATTLWGAA